MKISEVYAKVLDFYQDRSRFAKDYYQFNKEGDRCGWAVGHSFCVLGALGHFLYPLDLSTFPAQACLQRVAEHLYGDGTIGSAFIQVINDGPQGYEKIMQALKFAKDLWEGLEPTTEQTAMPVKQLPQYKQ